MFGRRGDPVQMTDRTAAKDGGESPGRALGRPRAQDIDPALARTWLMRSGRPEVTARWPRTAADVLVVDLEDAVPAHEKAAARLALRNAFAAGRRAWVRISSAGTEAWAEDAAAFGAPAGGGPAEGSGLLGVVLAKTESAEEVRRTRELFGPVPLVALIESARGLLAAPDIAAQPGVLRLGFGTGDFRRDTGVADTPATFAAPRVHLAVASAAAGLAGPIDGGARGVDPASLTAQAAVARDHGFAGKFALEEAQLAPLAGAFSPSSAEIAEASVLVAALDEYDPADGDALPRLAIARQVLERARAFGLVGIELPG